MSKKNAVELADALGYSRHEFNALVQMGKIDYTSEMTLNSVKKLFEKYYGGN